MLPVRDDNPQINKPIAVYIIIGLNIAAWFLIQGMGGTQLNESICHYGLIPSDLFSDGFGRFDSTGQCSNGAGWFGIFSSMFMHGSWMHIIGNMWFLYVFGDNIEDAMGSVRFVIFYVLSGIGAAAGPNSDRSRFINSHGWSVRSNWRRYGCLYNALPACKSSHVDVYIYYSSSRLCCSRLLDRIAVFRVTQRFI